ncbi:hypothetical protein ACWYXN_21810 [Janthinobacterium aestuarii]|uniref:Lipoprotein n=1 Tax=Janthinobacterium lividum TaxID=29581 RepID=A0A5C4NQM9_9BURK|nr:hypothetical protein [Janthinobacterium lividum]TNC75436.1 hypothetical protein FHI69_20255 [Janthinobacterium lividum]
MTMKAAILSTSCALLLAGCINTAPHPRYILPNPAQPSTTLTIKPIFTGSRKVAVVWRNEVDFAADGKWAAQRSFTLASFNKDYQSNPVVTRLPAGVSHFFVNYPLGSSHECSISFAAQLQEGHKYTLRTDDKAGGFFSLGGCGVSVHDDDTQQALPLMVCRDVATVFSSFFCRKPADAAAAGVP